MSQELKITAIKKEIIKRLNTIDGVSAQMGYFVHFEADESPLLAVLQADIETPDDKKRVTKQLRTRRFNLALGVRVGAKVATSDTLRDQLLVDVSAALFTELSNPLNGLATAFTCEGDIGFGLTESNNYMTAVVPLQVSFLQTKS